MIKKIILIGIFTILLLIPLVMNGNLYYLGGDDMRLYYLYPEKYLENYVFNLIGGNTLAGANTGYATVAYYAPMFYFIKLLKFIPLNTQFLMYGLNLAFGFLFFYKFLGLYIKKQWIINTCASLFYILSPFLVISHYKHQMLAMYLVSILPACIYLFISAVRENKHYLTALTVLIFSIFSTTVNSLPWWSAFMITTIPLLGYEFFKNKANFIKQLIVLMIFFGVLNIYWEYDFVKSQFFKSGIVNDSDFYNSKAFLADNLRVMKGVSTLFSPMNVLSNSPLDNFSKQVPLSVYFNFLFIIVIISSTFLVDKLKKDKKVIYCLFLLSFLVTWYLFSPNIGELGPRIFLYIGRTVPFFGMYRNMFDKFALPLAFFFASILAFALSTISIKLSKKSLNFLVLVMVILCIFNARNFLLSRYTSDQQINRLSGEFNEDFTSLVSYLNNLEDKSKVVWLPLNYPTYVNIEDKNIPGHYYSGLSPLRVLIDRSDYTGGFSFITQTDFFAGDKLFNLMEGRKYNEIGQMFQRMNAKYVVVDKQIFPTVMQPYLYGGEELPLLKYQDDAFKRYILGVKLMSFGSRYDLYEINHKFDSRPVYITNSLQGEYDGNSELFLNKIDNNTYRLKTGKIQKYNQLVLLESYDNNWKVFDIGKIDIGSELTHQVIFGYANLWRLDDLVDSSQNGEVDLLIKFTTSRNDHLKQLSLYFGFLLLAFYAVAAIRSNLKKVKKA